ncbi:MAG: tRNA (adenosine(37)-N6)-threonylcarbamoyltransferase complex ATPase subunit type 1 TsaE [Candidatus Paceibacterota bacterium]
MKMETKNPDETASLASSFIADIKPDNKQASVIRLFGGLGAGKTTFITAVGRVLGFTGRINSPTFIIYRRYPLPAGGPWRYLIHLDAYRLTDEADPALTPLVEQITNPTNLIMVEWPENIPALFAGIQTRDIYFDFIDDNTRLITYDR